MISSTLFVKYDMNQYEEMRISAFAFGGTVLTIDTIHELAALVTFSID